MAERPKKEPASSLVQREDFSFTGDIKVRGVETRVERASRLRIEEATAAHERESQRADAEHRRRKEQLVHRTIVAVVAFAVCLCLWVLLRSGYSAEDRKWAETLLTTIVSAGVGYLTGRASKSE